MDKPWHKQSDNHLSFIFTINNINRKKNRQKPFLLLLFLFSFK
jgi:hypothetical protein